MQPVVIINLTDEQKQSLEPIIQIALSAAYEGTPGMIIGQFFTDQVRVGFIPNNKALTIQSELGGEPGKIRFSAIDEAVACIHPEEN